MKSNTNLTKTGLKQRALLLVSFFLIFATSLVVYFPSISGEFVWDDQTYFVANDILTKLKPNDIKEVFLYPSNYWGEHYPLRDYLYVIEYNLFGENPAGYHIISLVIFFACAFVLFLFTKQLFINHQYENTSSRKHYFRGNIGPLIIISLFLLNPTYVESVAYISGQKDILSLFFILLSLYFLHRTGISSGKAYLLTFILGVFFHYCAVLSKYSALATIFFIPILWATTAKKTNRDLIKISSIWIVANIPVFLWVVYENVVKPPFVDHLGVVTPFLERIPRAINLIGIYLEHIVWPWPLSFGYPFENHRSFDLHFVFGLIFLITLLAFGIFRKKSLVFLGLSVFLVYLLPILQIYPEMVNAKVFDRYLAMPLIGLLIVLERLIWAFTRGWSARHIYAVCFLLFITSSWGYMLMKYIPTFNSNVAAMEHQYRIYPGGFTTSFNLADAWIYDGQLEKAETFVREEEVFQNPDWLYDFLLGEISLQRGELDKALQLFSTARHKTYIGGYFPIADVFLAEVLIKKGDYTAATNILKNLLSHKRKDPLVIYRALELMREIELTTGEKNGPSSN